MAGILRQNITGANQQVTKSTVGSPNVGIGLTTLGTYSGTTNIFGSYDGVNFNTIGIMAYPPSTTGTMVYSVTGAGNYFVPTSSLNLSSGRLAAIRLNAVSQATGTLQVAIADSTDGAFANAYVKANSLQLTASASGDNTTLSIGAHPIHGWQLSNIIVSTNKPITTASALSIIDGANTIGAIDILDSSTVSIVSGQIFTFSGPYNISPGNPGSLVMSSIAGVLCHLNATASAI